MPTTSNFGWTTPADTDLVKDGAAAIRTLGNGIDTSLVDLKGGTTGQVLSKTSNTDLDFTWSNAGDITEVVAGTGLSGGGSSGSVTLTNTVATAFDAAGDLVYGTGADTFTKLALGTAGKVLTVNSGATAPEWVTPVSGSMTLLSTTSLAAVTTVTISGISQDYQHLEILIEDFDFASNDKAPALRLNGDTGSNYRQEVGLGNSDTFETYFDCSSGSNVNEGGMIYFRIPFYANSAISKVALHQRTFLSSTGAGYYRTAGTFGSWKATPAAITSITVFNRTDSTNFDAGNVKIYGVK